ncbi:MAG: hypothetical protein AB8B79_14075 [Granulosicoccus sp.]
MLEANAQPFDLHADPDWHSAAQDLISGLCALPDSEQQIELLETVCVRLGDRLYPAFLQILHVIDQHADEQARAIMSRTLVDCLQSGRLPSGKLSAWGSSSFTGDSAFGQSRRLGPVEFVCAWYAQPSSETPMSQQQFSLILESLLSLVASDSTAKQLYCYKLIADAEDPLGGSLSSQTRTGLLEMVKKWQTIPTDESNASAVDAFLSALQQESLLNQISNRPFS